MGGRGGKPEGGVLPDSKKLEEFILDGLGSCGGSWLLRLADFGLLGFTFCTCPGQAAPGSGTASAVRMARAAEIARRLAEPRNRGVGGEAGVEITSTSSWET